MRFKTFIVKMLPKKTERRMFRQTVEVSFMAQKAVFAYWIGSRLPVGFAAEILF